MCNLQLPFQGRGIGELISNIMSRNLREFSASYSVELRAIAANLLQYKAYRPSLSQVMATPFFMEALREEYAFHTGKITVSDSELFTEREISEEIS